MGDLDGFEPMTLPMKNRDALHDKSRKEKAALAKRLLSDLDGIRTHDPLIKSQVLYRLSYEI